MASEPAQARLLWDNLSLALLIKFGHTTASRSLALVFSAATHFTVKRSVPCSTAFRHSPSSWVAVVHWSALILKALRPSRKHPLHSLSCPPHAGRRYCSFVNRCSDSGSCDGLGAVRRSGTRAGSLSVPQPYSIVSSTSARSIRILSSRGALGWSYCSRVYFRKLHHALRMRRSTSMDRSALWLMILPRYTNSFVWLYNWPLPLRWL